MKQRYSELTQDILVRTGVMMVDDHFALRSGMHSAIYFNHHALFEEGKEEDAQELAEMMAQMHIGTTAEVLVGIETGGEKFANLVAPALSRKTGREIPAFPCKKNTEGERGFHLPEASIEGVRGKRVLVIEDACSTDRGAAWMAAQEVLKADGNLLGIRAIVNRGELTAEKYGVKSFRALLNFTVQMFKPGACPLCVDLVPINRNFGHGKHLP